MEEAASTSTARAKELTSKAWLAAAAKIKRRDRCWIKEFLDRADAAHLHLGLAIFCDVAGVYSLTTLGERHAELKEQTIWASLLSVTKDRVMRQLACDLASASATDVSVARSGGAGVLLQFGETLDIDRSSTDRSSADRGSAGVSNTDTEVNSTTLQLADIQPSVLQTDYSALVRSFANEASESDSTASIMLHEVSSRTTLVAGSVVSSCSHVVSREGAELLSATSNTEPSLASSSDVVAEESSVPTSRRVYPRVTSGAVPTSGRNPTRHVQRSSVLDTVDTTGDGLVDSVVLDTTGDGLADATRRIEFRYPHPRERILARRASKGAQQAIVQKQLSSGHAGVDVTGDGHIDAVALDTVGDGHVDTLRPLRLPMGAAVSSAM